MTEPKWGLGAPYLVKPATRNITERVVGLFDAHVPYEDRTLMELTVRAIADIKPHRIIIGGDWWDLSILSRWEASLRASKPIVSLMKQVRGDLNLGVEYLRAIRKAAPNATIDFIEGNHDERLRGWLGDSMGEGRDMAIRMMLPGDLNINYHNRCGFFLRDDFLVKHGDYCTVQPAKKEYDESRCGGWSGHVHKVRTWEEEYPATLKRYHWTTAPVLCRRDYDYGAGQSGVGRWSQGFLVGCFSTVDPYDYTTDVARYRNGRLRLWGKTY